MSPRAIGPVSVTTGDVLIALAFLAFLGALAYPTVRVRAFRSLVEDVSSEVETMRSAAAGVFSRDGRWPDAGAPSAIPSELAGAFSGDSTLARDAYTLQWSRWEVVDYLPPPRASTPTPTDADAPPDSVGPRLVAVIRDVGAIVVHSGNDALLAALLARHGPAVSFVRDTTWTLTVEAPGGTSGG
ncbi:MAG: hypothetical protein O2956_14915 [Gemmatimonadetes bacterium]|nr:hypothetical protein [Gemmatimonadota bacterium]